MQLQRVSDAIIFKILATGQNVLNPLWFAATTTAPAFTIGAAEFDFTGWRGGFFGAACRAIAGTASAQIFQGNAILSHFGFDIVNSAGELFKTHLLGLEHQVFCLFFDFEIACHVKSVEWVWGFYYRKKLAN